MSKESSIKRFPSVRNNFAKESRESDGRETEPEIRAQNSQESQLARKIQQKLKMRKRSSNVPSLSQLAGKGGFETADLAGSESAKNLKETETSVQIPCLSEAELIDTIDRVLEDQVAIGLGGIDPGAIRSEMLGESEIITCKLGREYSAEAVIKDRIQKFINGENLKARIAEMEDSLMAKLEAQLQKLSAQTK